jgi:hypothetical protein
MEIRIYADEVVLGLARLPVRIREMVEQKMARVMDDVREQTFSKKPGVFVDSSTVQMGVTTHGNTVIGYIETTDKKGVYSILPSKARALRFIAKSGDIVHTKAVYNHPYLKGSKMVEQTLLEMKPWIIDTLEDAVVEAL